METSASFEARSAPLPYPTVMMDWDSITRTGARAPGVERQIRWYGGAHKRIVPDTEQGITLAAESTKGDGKPVIWEGLV